MLQGLPCNEDRALTHRLLIVRERLAEIVNNHVVALQHKVK